MKRFIQLISVSLSLVFGWAQAGTTALGFELGVTTVDQFRSTLPKQSKLTDQGQNSYSAGPQFKTDGAPFEIGGLRDVTFIFDEQKKLAAILMTMGKSDFDSVFSAVSKKYKVATQQRPFVGNQYARFNTPDAVIELNAPHLSFDMDVQYMRNDLLKKFQAESSAQAAAKKKKEADKF